MKRELNQNYVSLPEDNFGQQEADEREYSSSCAEPQAVHSRRQEIPSRENQIDMDTFRQQARSLGPDRRENTAEEAHQEMYRETRRKNSRKSRLYREAPIVGRFADYGKGRFGWMKRMTEHGLFPLFLSWGSGAAVGTLSCLILAFFNYLPHQAVQPSAPAAMENAAENGAAKENTVAAASEMPEFFHSTALEWQDEVMGDVPSWNQTKPMNAPEPIAAADKNALGLGLNQKPAVPAAVPAGESVLPVAASIPMEPDKQETASGTKADAAFPSLPADMNPSDVYLGAHTPGFAPEPVQTAAPKPKKTAIRENTEYGWNHLSAEENIEPVTIPETAPMKNEVARFVPTAVNTGTDADAAGTGEIQTATRPATAPKGRFADYQIQTRTMASAGDAGTRPVSATAMLPNAENGIR